MGIGEGIFSFGTNFLEDVVFGNEVAGTWVKGACEEGGENKVI